MNKEKLQKELENNKSFLYHYINQKCIFRCPPGYYLDGIPAGKQYSWQFYLRKAIFDSDALFCITQWLFENHDDNYQYAAMETAGPPMLAALKMYGKFKGKDIDGFSIRKTKKAYGLKNWIEGNVVEKPVIILDDLANSKSTIERAKMVCEAHGLTVHSARTIVNKQMVDHVGDLPVLSMFMVNEFNMAWDTYHSQGTEEEILKFVSMYPNDVLKKF